VIAFTGAAGFEIWINALEVNAVRVPLANEFDKDVQTVIFAGTHKFGVCEQIELVVAKIKEELEW
jgi:hypothetical protein